ncbi:GIN domain-containing protein [Pedobacter frigoris]|uniref:DUF2807 domain-containing protein n=1 Tax=Pedobacter frigoris TaxID=2571272 RepID=A0A4U1CPV6_9SPHI|nr:DUF2807 domain-containing protein [Pedobacter frigoris]TKC07464.1 DUF2807 domain-containing protein [Pedobacter frigoris]
MKIKFKVKSMLFCIAAMLLLSCSKERLNANGNQVSQIRETGSFKAVNVSGASSVFIAYGSTFKVELKGSDNLISKFVTQVEGEELILKYKDVNVNGDDLKIYITMPMVTSIKTNGSSNCELSGDFAQQDKFIAKVYGAGNITVYGNLRANIAEAEVLGSGNISIEKVLSKGGEFKISGSGNITAAVSEKLNAKISGSGNVYYIGTPDLTTAYTGSGRVIKK